MQRFLRVVCAGMTLIAAGTALAQDPNTNAGRPIQEIRGLLTGLETSFSAGDAKAVAACWTNSGDFAGPSGERIEGRENIEKAFRDVFSAGKARSLKLQVLSVRVPREGLALVDVIPDTKPAAGEAGGEAVMSLVLVKSEGKWLIESARETISRVREQTQPMKDLEWLVGEWADDGSLPGGASLRTSCDWTVNRAFLIRKFKVEGKSGPLRNGTEIIGWDPRAKRIRSWVFDASGGFGENVWIRDGNRWLIRYSGTSPDGGDVSATNVLTVVDANTVTLQSKDRMANGERQPEIAEVTIKRQVIAKEPVRTKEPRRVPQPQRVLP